jgi:hypothetical protein
MESTKLDLFWEEEKTIRSPCDLIYSAYSFMCYWSGPYPEGTHHRAISDGVDLMLRMTNKLLGSAGVKQGPALPDSQDADLKPEDEEKSDMGPGES